MVVGLVFWLANTAWHHLGRLPMYLASERLGAVAALSGAICYAALVGFALPTQRAAVMIVIGMLVLWTRSHFAPMVAFSIAIVLILILDPVTVVAPRRVAIFCGGCGIVVWPSRAGGGQQTADILAHADCCRAGVGTIGTGAVWSDCWRWSDREPRGRACPRCNRSTAGFTWRHCTGAAYQRWDSAADVLSVLVVVLNFFAQLRLLYEHWAAPSPLHFCLAVFGGVIALTRLPMRWLAELCGLPLSRPNPCPSQMETRGLWCLTLAKVFQYSYKHVVTR